MTRYLRWQVSGEEPNLLRLYFTGDLIPPEIDVDTWWNGLPQYAGDPLVVTSYTLDPVDEFGSRMLVDTMNRNDGGLTPAFPSGAAVTAQPAAFADQIELGLGSDVAPPGSTDNDVMRVRWGTSGGLIGGSVHWSFQGLDISEATHLSIRLANIVDIPDPTTAGCMAVSTAPVTLRVILETAGDAAGVATDPLVAQDFEIVTRPLSQSLCAWHQFLQTVRIPLSTFCNQGIPLAQVTGLRLQFGFPLTTEGEVAIDSIELTRSTFDAAGAQGC